MSEEAVWEPTGYYAEESNIARFMATHGYDDYGDLIPETEADLARVWGNMADDVNIVWREPYETVVDTADGVEFADWYAGGRLNAAETILDQWVERTPERAMYAWTDERMRRETVSYREMARRTDRLANALRDHGVGRGDVVGVTFPMHPNGFVASLACLRIGAAFTQIFPGYGASAMGHRLDDSGAEWLLTADGYYRGGDRANLLSKVDSAIEVAPAVDDVVVYEHLGLDGTVEDATVHDWTSFLDGYDAEAESAVVDSDHPAFIAYSSGTTGTPKGAIHTHASLLAMGNKEAKYHFDLGGDDTLMWVTDFGWIIVPIWMLAGAPALGATTVLLEGAPTHPEENRVWRAIEEHDVTAFGISPTGARGLREVDTAPRDRYDLSSLRVLGSTGEPRDEDGWLWFFEAVGGGAIPIINAAGGTELAGAILTPTPKTSLKPGSLSGPAPGVAANIYDESGTTADEGYLVIELPIPGMTHSLTDGDERYLEEYWSDFEGVWNHKDWAERDADGFWFITGRADDTMNIAGRRVTAPEIEETIVEHPDVSEAAVVPVPDERKGQVPVAFVTLRAGVQTDEDRLEVETSERVAENLGAPYRPVAVHVVPALPRTQTGKLPRNVIEAVYLGNPAGDVSTLDGAAALEEFPEKDDP